MRHKGLQNYFQRLCVDRYADQRKFWSTIKPYINSRKGKQNECIVLKDNERIIRDKREVAEFSNNFFTSFGITEQSISGVKSTPNLSHIQKNFIPKHPFSLKKTNPVEVKEVMLKVKMDKATGHNNIPPRASRESAEILCYPFSVLFNHNLENSRIPQQWKVSVVSPVFKRDCCLMKSNYRPITILPSLSKIFKTLIHSRISHYFAIFFTNMNLRTEKITVLILLSSVSQNSGGKNLINTILLELYLWTCQRFLTPCHMI